MKVYEAIYSDIQRQGVFGISLVENPAMEDEWIALLGAVLIPNKKIYRNVDGHEFYITFTEETISNLAHDFIKKGYQNSSSAEHEVALTGVSFVESWQVEDSAVDKSALYGKKYEKGTWVTMAKVSPELYKQATDGTFKGFSVDALLGLQELNFNKQEMTKTDFLTELKNIFSFTTEEVVVDKVEEVQEEEVVETKAEEVAEVKAPELNVEALTNALKETLAQFKADVDKSIADLKTELSTEKVEVEAKIEELETELDKQPEVAAIVASPESKSTPSVQTKTPRSIKGRVLANLRELNLN
jgi:hypothetical protein